MSSLNVDAVRKISRGDFVSTSLAHRTDELIICFTIEGGLPSAVAGNRQFYIQVVGPEGIILGKKLIRKKIKDSNIVLSKILKFTYNNNELEVCDSFLKDEKGFKKGSYRIRIYRDDLILLAESRFALK